MDATAERVGEVADDASADRFEDRLHRVVERLVEEALRVRAVTGREDAGAGLVDDAHVPRVDEFVAESLNCEALDVLQGLAGADDDGDAPLVELREEMQHLAGNLVVGVASRPERLVDVQHEHVHRPVVLRVEVECGVRLVASQPCGISLWSRRLRGTHGR